MFGNHKSALWSRVMAAVTIAAVGWLVLQAGMDPRHFQFSQVHGLRTAEWFLVLLGAAIGFVLLSLPLLVALFSGLAAIAFTIVISRATRPEAGIWFGWIVWFVQIAIALVWKIVISTISSRRERRLLLDALKNYFPLERAKQFTSLRYRKLFEPGTERRDLSTVFSDHPLLGDCAYAVAGAMVKDASGRAIAIWNAPELQKDHAGRACKAALRIAKRGGWAGISTGVATVGNFASGLQINYAASGENIDLVPRVAALNTLLGTRVLLTMETRRWMSDNFVTRYMGNFRFAPGEESVGIYELMGADDVDEMGRSLRDSFEQAVYAFQGSDREDARASFERVLQVYPEDQPSKFYLQRIEALAGEPWPYDWSGTLEVTV